MQGGWTDVSGLLRQAKSGAARPADDDDDEQDSAPAPRPRLAVLLAAASADGAQRRATRKNVRPAAVTAGPGGAVAVGSASFRFDWAAAAADGGARSLFEAEVSPLLREFVEQRRSGAVVMAGPSSAQLGGALRGERDGAPPPGPARAAGAQPGSGGLLPMVLQHLVSALAGSDGEAWDVVVSVAAPEAAGTMVHHTPVDSPASSPRVRPVTVRLEVQQDVATVCEIVNRQLLQAWGDAEAAVGGQVVCTVRRDGHSERATVGQSPRRAASTPRMLGSDNRPSFSVVAFGTVEVCRKSRQCLRHAVSP